MSDRTARAHDLLERALERDPGERAGFLADACADEPELRAYVEALLAADEGADTFFADFARRSGLPHAAIPTLLPIATGSGRTGSCENSGGAAWASSIWRDGTMASFDHTVALKLIRSGADHASVRRRFLRERQILAAARVQHALEGDEPRVVGQCSRAAASRCSASSRSPVSNGKEMRVASACRFPGRSRYRLHRHFRARD